MYLLHAGFRVVTSENAIIGIQLAVEHQPDVILMDAGLPGLSGWEAVREIKGDPRIQRIPVIMLTGHVLADSRDMAEAAGADGFIAKPCLPDELVKIIKRALAHGPTAAPAEGVRSETKAEGQDRLSHATEDLKIDHARLARNVTPFNKADHDAHRARLAAHKRALARQKRRKD